MRLFFSWKLNRILAKQKEQDLLAYRDRLNDSFEQELCNIALAVLYFSRRDNGSAYRLFGKAHALMRTRQDRTSEYFRLFCLVYISLLRQNLEAATTYAQHGRILKMPVAVRAIFPMPNLEDKVLYQKSIEAIG